MSIADLLVVLDVLDTPLFRVHYFLRRSEWEANVSYWGDEEDLLVYYLSEGLDSERENQPLMLYGNSEYLHNFYMAEWAGEGAGVPKPRRMLTRWWTDLIARLKRRRADHQWDILCVLLDVPYRDQQRFENEVRAITAQLRRRSHAKSRVPDSVVFTTPPTGSKGALGGFCFRQLSRQDRDQRACNVAARAFTDEAIHRVVLIGRDIDREGEPYDFLGYMTRSRLADTHTGNENSSETS
jgi:hypothetical protein